MKSLNEGSLLKVIPRSFLSCEPVASCLSLSLPSSQAMASKFIKVELGV